MSGDEVMVTIISGLITPVLGGAWYLRVLSPSPMLSSRIFRWPLWLSPLLGLAMIVLILATFASGDVRDDFQYIVMYTLMGSAWVLLAIRLFPLLGLVAIDDVAERHNAGAGCLFAGAQLGVALAYAGGNIGDGPGWWVVCYSSGLATAALLGVWAVLNAAAALTQQVVIDRDLGCGIRLGALLLGLGAIFGRAVAGTWSSSGATLMDFITVASPSLLILIPELALSWVFRPIPQRPNSPPFFAGVVPGAVYLAGAAGYIYSMGWWK